MENQKNMNLKPLTTKEGWSSRQIQILGYGGNSRLDEFLGPYLLSLEKDKFCFNVFNLKACEFYSKRLDSFGNSGYFSEPPPSLKEGTKLIEDANLLDLDYLPRDGNDCELEILGSDEKSEPERDDDKDFFDSLDNNVKEVFETTGDIFQEHASKFWDSTSGIRDKTKEAWEKSNKSSQDFIDKTGQFTKGTWDKTVNIFKGMGKDIQKLTDSKEDTDNKAKGDKLNLKNLFGFFSKKEEEKKDNTSKPKPEPEQQFFDFGNSRGSKEQNSERSSNLASLKEELKALDGKNSGSTPSAEATPSDDSPQKPLIDFQ